MNARIERDITALRDIPAEVARVLEGRRRDLNRIRSRGLHASFAERITLGARQRLEELEAKRVELRDRIGEELNAVLKPPERDATARLVDEVQGQRTWSRMQRRLERSMKDSAVPDAVHKLAVHMLEQAVKAGDDVTLRVLRDELVPYLEDKDQGATAALLADGVRSAERKAAPVEVVVAEKGLEALGSGLYRVGMAITMGLQEITEDGYGPVIQLPGYAEHESVQVEFVPTEDAAPPPPPEPDPKDFESLSSARSAFARDMDDAPRAEGA